MAAAIVAIAWTGVALGVGPARRFLADLGTWLVARLPYPLFAVAALLTGALVTSLMKSPELVAASVATGLLALAGARRAFASNRRRACGLALLLVLNLLLLALGDLFVRRFVMPNSSHNDIFVVHDPWLGWKLRPSWTIDRNIKIHDYVSHETSNRLGFRGPDYPIERPAGTRRIVVLGDSHTEGYTVNDGETWPEQMERALAKTQVESFAVGGFSTDQEYLAWLHYARPYRPDLVLLQFCSNDPPDNVGRNLWRGRKPSFTRFGDQLVLEGLPVPDDRLSFTHDTWLAHSAIALMYQISLGKLAVANDATIDAGDAEAWEVTRLLLRALAHAVAADGARFALFHSGPDERDVDARIRTLCQEESILFLDIAPAFGGDYASFRVKDDTHWNQRGHAAVGRLLATQVAPLLERR
jgi:lysophospholipase L1-like esterase